MVLTGNARAGRRGAIRLDAAPPLREKAVIPSGQQRQGKLTPCHFQRIADRGACGKPPVVLQNRRPDQERTKTWGHDVRVLLQGNGARLPRRYRDDRAVRVRPS